MSDAPATKRDLDELAATTKRDLGELAETTKRDLGELAETTKHAIDELRIELRAELASKQDLNNLGTRLRAELASKHDLANLEGTLRAELASKRDLVDMELRQRSENDKASANAAYVVLEGVKNHLAVVDEKYQDLPHEVATLRIAHQAHVANADVHVPPRTPKQRARRSRSR